MVTPVRDGFEVEGRLHILDKIFTFVLSTCRQTGILGPSIKLRMIMLRLNERVSPM